MSATALPRKHRAIVLPVLAVAGVSLLLAACSSSNKTSTSGAGNTPTTSAASPTTASGESNASVTITTANLPGVGTVLVDGNGNTLYVLDGEKGKVTCTSSGNCTGIWPPVVVPSGMSQGIAGAGVQASLLGTAMGPAGDTRVTYNGWPLYTFSGDKGPHQTKGQALKDVYGLWWTLSPSGNPVKTSGSSPSPTTAGASSGGAGF